MPKGKFLIVLSTVGLIKKDSSFQYHLLIKQNKLVELDSSNIQQYQT